VNIATLDFLLTAKNAKKDDRNVTIFSIPLHSLFCISGLFLIEENIKKGVIQKIIFLE
jgi:hypothetical protein